MGKAPSPSHVTAHFVQYHLYSPTCYCPHTFASVLSTKFTSASSTQPDGATTFHSIRVCDAKKGVKPLPTRRAPTHLARCGTSSMVPSRIHQGLRLLLAGRITRCHL